MLINEKEGIVQRYSVVSSKAQTGDQLAVIRTYLQKENVSNQISNKRAEARLTK